MDNLQDTIDDARMELLRVMKQREDEREKFVENQVEHAKKQNLFFQGLERLKHPKVAVPPRYMHELLALSEADYSPYVIKRETELCRALHQVEIYTIQLQLLKKHHEKMLKSMKSRLAEECLLSEEIEEILLRTIKFVSIDMTGRAVENKARLSKQRHQIALLRGEKSNSQDVADFGGFDDCMTESTASSPSDLFQMEARMNQQNKRIDRENRRMSMEKRIIEVGSYLGVIQTAKAA
mmetsp:Transcript_29015/g.43840  ORF Transcript_29015/g.43840 Transcript_29015/m.43840 type:complete len:237 (+) Transcript_29015:173-883(+)|eukprot:CAMPEP_0178898224 /NCGR_PEP_ID=MMETSP0786-20121207/2208_1 /TAXON_ID=186022 /ORGANISM="Thalassionema frauenfeldii, Strain CCMP 1798" /LENGTH=236 /DNA_ID=CAMNT_0020568911 /DNA_START=35 /DNA_END=745 /DNA_ORIENTATION=+